jgi:hypothetical protein
MLVLLRRRQKQEREIYMLSYQANTSLSPLQWIPSEVSVMTL